MTAVGAHGRTGVPALGRVQREPRRGPGNVMTPRHSMEALSVQALPRRNKAAQKVVLSSWLGEMASVLAMYIRSIGMDTMDLSVMMLGIILTPILSASKA